MHDLDRTLNEFDMEYGFEAGAFESESDGQGEWQGEWLGESDGEMDEAEVASLAAELLEVQDEEELDQFFGKLLKRAAGAVKTFAQSSTGKALGGILKQAAGKALPMLGTAVGGYLGGPAGAKLGGQAAAFAKGQLGLEMEMDQEAQFEVASDLVRTAMQATQRAVRAANAGPPQVVARQAVLQAAQRVAPQLARVIASGPAGPGGRGAPAGRWIRRGRTIVLLGV